MNKDLLDTIKPKLDSLQESIAKMKKEAKDKEDLKKSKGGIMDKTLEEIQTELNETKAALAEAKTAKDKEVAEAFKKAKEDTAKEFEAKAAKDKKDAEDKKMKDDKDADDAKAALVEASAAKDKADKVAWLAKMKKAMSSEELAELGVEFTDAEKAVASEKSYADLVKMVASLNSELAEVHAAKKKVEDESKAEARYKELSEKGLAFIGTSASKQKEKIKVMNDEAFASYSEELGLIAETVNTKEGFVKEAVESAKASVGALSQPAEDETDFSKFSKLRA